MYGIQYRAFRCGKNGSWEIYGVIGMYGMYGTKSMEVRMYNTHPPPTDFPPTVAIVLFSRSRLRGAHRGGRWYIARRASSVARAPGVQSRASCLALKGLRSAPPTAAQGAWKPKTNFHSYFFRSAATSVAHHTTTPPPYTTTL